MRLTEGGQCPCGREPVAYKFSKIKFCSGCCRQFDMATGKQVENFGWQQTAGGAFETRRSDILAEISSDEELEFRWGVLLSAIDELEQATQDDLTDHLFDELRDYVKDLRVWLRDDRAATDEEIRRLHNVIAFNRELAWREARREARRAADLATATSSAP